MIKDQLMPDLKQAMKDKDTIKKSTITMLRAAIKQREVDQRTTLDEGAVIDIIVKQIKQKRAAIEDFARAKRQDMIDETKREIDILSSYLPDQLSSEELSQIIDQVIARLQATSIKDMGRVMSEVKTETAGKADPTDIADQVKARLSTTGK